MAQRQLTQQQKRRQANKQIQHKHDAILHSPEQVGLVVAHFGKQLIIESPTQERFECNTRQNLGTIVTGDKVIWHPTDQKKKTGVIVARCDRKNLISRIGHYKKAKELAANVTQLVIVGAINPMPLDATIDRYLVLAHHLQLKPLIILNKWDLYNTLSNESQDWFNQRIKTYQALNYPLLTQSLKENHANEAKTSLRKALQDETSILVGQSGVGKSTLINFLIPDAMAKEGVICDEKGLGKHTTTTTMLYHLPSQGNLIDSPGIRQFDLHELEPQKFMDYFPEFKALKGLCKFRDCSHHATLLPKDCALQASVFNNTAAAFRLDSYLQILEQLQKPS